MDETEDKPTYKIVRMYLDARPHRRTIWRGLSLEDARRHCSDPESSSRTCTTTSGTNRTRKLGAWFDGYEREK